MTHSDSWLDFSKAENDGLGRMPAVLALQRMLVSDTLSTPIVVGVYGGWGTGKTSVMKTLLAQLDAPERLQLWFDSWVYARQEEALWRALLLRVIEALRARSIHPDDLRLQGEAYDAARRAFDTLWADKQAARQAAERLDQASTSLYRSLTLSEKGGVRVKWSAAVPLAADVALTALTAGLSTHIATAVAGKDGPTGPLAALAKWVKGGDTKEAMKIFEREATEHYVEQVSSLEQFQLIFRELLGLFGIGRDGRRLFIYVDDLDRCLPEDAVAALEAIKLFLDLPGCVFILGMDRAVVEQGIRVRYKDFSKAEFNAAEYLDKIIQIPFNLPHLGPAVLDAFLARLPLPPLVVACGELIRLGAQPNPRTFKRVLNALLLSLYLYGYSDEQMQSFGESDRRTAGLITKLMLLQVCFEPIWLLLIRRDVSLGDLERYFRESDFQLRESDKVDSVSQLTGVRLETLFKAEPNFAQLSAEDAEALISLTRVTARKTNP